MKLRTQLTIAFLVCGIVPLLVSGIINYRTAGQGLNTTNTKGSTALRTAAANRLIAVREIKKQHLLDYFDTVKNQIVQLSSDGLVVEAMRDFKKAHGAYTTETNVKPEEIQNMKKDLLSYYTQEFLTEYKKHNTADLDVNKIVNQLDDTSVVLQHDYIKANPHPLGAKDEYLRSSKQTSYNELHDKFHPSLRSFLKTFKYYDIFLVDSKTGNVVYSVFKELDYCTSLINGPYANSGIGEAFRKANATNASGEFCFIDYQQYLPSYSSPASFISAPIFEDGNKIGVLIFQLPLYRINEVMTLNEVSGGKTGEAIAVGSDYKMRSDSVKEPDFHTVEASFRNPTKGSVKTEATQAAFNEGKSGLIECQDYRGENTFISYGPVDILGSTWCLNAKVDTAEALEEVRMMEQTNQESRTSLIYWMLGVGGGSVLVVILIATFVSGRISKPIIQISAYADKVATGDLASECEVKATGEVGGLVKSMNTMRLGLRKMVVQLTENASTLSTSSTQISGTAEELVVGADETTEQSTSVSAAAEEMATNMSSVSDSTEEMSSGIEMVASAVEEMTASIGEISQNAEKAASVAENAASLTTTSGEKISSLGNAADEIGKVIEVIEDIAEQTNLLALNATIEAARAGEAGKGFAVVATEVKELAKQTSDATDDIRHRIQGIQGSTKEVIESIGAIQEVISNVNDVSRTIASAVEEQRVTTNEIADRVSETSNSAKSISLTVAESAAASKEITTNMVSVDSAARKTATGAGETRDAGQKLLTLADDIQGLIAEFEI